MTGNVGLICALALLIVLALRGINIVFASLLASLVIVITNQLSIAESFNEYFVFGPLGAFTFAGKFFLLFASGAMFGRVMGESHAAASIAYTLASKLGAHRTLWIATIACALLTYGGVVVFVVIFAIYPLGLKLVEQANIPKRLLLGAIALGSGTFTLSALPGTPSVQNVISSVALGTDLFAGASLGIVATLIMFGCGMWYLEHARVNAQANNEIFVASERDRTTFSEDQSSLVPDWHQAIIPLVVVLATIVTPRLLLAVFGDGLKGSYPLISFAYSQSILWPSIALCLGSVVSIVLFPAVRSKPLKVMGEGMQDSIVPLINTAVVIGFGGIVTHTPGFSQFTAFMLNVDLPPLLSMFASVSMSSALVGSAAGGLQIFMQTMAPAYLEMGIPADVLHRLATIASGGFDSLPHCGAVVAMLTITGLTHRQAYKDIFYITVAIPVIASLVAMLVAATLFM